MNASVVRSCKTASRACGAIGAGVGLTGLLGWALDADILRTAFVSPVVIKANTATCLTLLGCALVMLAPEGDAPRRWRLIGRVAASIAALLGGLTLLQHLTGVNLGIDEMVFKEAPGAPMTTSPGRMGPPASTSFLLSGIALVIIDVRTAGGRSPSQWLALVVGLIALLPLIGYAYGIQSLYGIAKYTGIAANTAVAIAALAIGLLTARPTDGLMKQVCADDAGGVMARRLLLPAILIPLALGWLRTMGERAGLFDAAFGRPILILSLIVSFTTLVWWNARALSALGRAGAAAEAARLRGEQTLREERERLRLGLIAGNTGTWDWDIVRNHVTWSERVYEFHAMKPGEFGGRVEDFTPLIHPDDRDRVGAAIRDAVETRAPYNTQYRALQPGGGVRWIVATGQVYYDAEGKPVRMMGAVSDITATKETEVKLREAKDVAEAASRAKDEFVATLSHELRTPLTPVMLTVSLMESHPGLPEELRDDVATIRRNVELESRLISDLLDLTRIEKGKLQLNTTDLDLHLIVRSAIDICQREASAILTVELKAKRHTVHGDGTRLQQVFWNLINNAIKFTGSEGAITVRSSDCEDGSIRVEVQDTGAGIDPATLPQLFKAFEQGEVRTEQRFAGLGLGLAISRRLVEAHGGTIAAFSEGRGRGATFTVGLPAMELSVAVLAPHRPVTPQTAGRTLNVLLVEDHEPTLRALTKLLKSLGHRVTGTTSVTTATAAASTDGFDVIVSDLGLPDGSGLDVMRQLRHTYAGRVIALTGYGMESDIAASREAGFAEHLTKPVDVEALEAAIRRVS